MSTYNPWQIAFAGIVLGLSISLARHQLFGPVPATTSYSAFAGAFAMLAALIGVAAIFVEAIQGLIMPIIDALAALLLLAAGIPNTRQHVTRKLTISARQAIAVGLKGVSCTNPYTTTLNKLLNGGDCGLSKGEINCEYTSYNELKGRCQKAEADAVFVFLAFLVTLGLIGLAFLFRKRGGGQKAVV
ncbi:hypothetical protein LTR66_007705 [Elasticomyces elasticus]|nr:hypothetical protein LTR66_007705 [Elasticomyces elasticus]